MTAFNANFGWMYRDTMRQGGLVVSASPGFSVEGLALPRPDIRNTDNALLGTMKRAAMSHPLALPGIIRRLKAFTKEYCLQHYTPLPRDINLCPTVWLEKTSYNINRKIEVATTILDPVCPRMRKKFYTCKGFVKEETYPEYKYPRDIFARSDDYKAAFGPFCKAVEEVVYKDPAFVKNVRVDKRGEYIAEMLKGGQIYTTDFTAFESQFTPQLMRAVEYQLYKHMARNLPDKVRLLRMIKESQMTTNTVQFHSFFFETVGCRMSGEMSTSLANGFSNLMFILFAHHMQGVKPNGVCVEGDDGIFTTDAPLNPQNFVDMGLTIKLQRHRTYATASFCGIVFDPEVQHVVPNISEALTAFGWVSNKYIQSRESTQLALLKMKALSTYHQYRGCPMLQEFAEAVIECTKWLSVQRAWQSLNAYEIDMLSMYEDFSNGANVKFVKHDIQVDERTRRLVAETQGISIETQLRFEQWCREVKASRCIKNIPHWAVNAHADWYDFHSNYVFTDNIRHMQRTRLIAFPPSRRIAHVEPTHAPTYGPEMCEAVEAYIQAQLELKRAAAVVPQAPRRNGLQLQAVTSPT